MDIWGITSLTTLFVFCIIFFYSRYLRHCISAAHGPCTLPLHDPTLLPRVHYHWFRKWNAISSLPSPELRRNTGIAWHCLKCLLFPSGNSTAITTAVTCVAEDLLESPAVAGLGFIHFALSRHSQEAQAILAGRRPQSVLDGNERCADAMEFANLP